MNTSRFVRLATVLTVFLLALTAGFVTRRLALEPPPSVRSVAEFVPLVFAPVIFVLGQP